MRFPGSRTSGRLALLGAFIGTTWAQGPVPPAAPPPPTPLQAPRGRIPGGGGPDSPRAQIAGGTYTTVTGTISQFNYNQEAEIDGFVLSNNSLIQLPRGLAVTFGMSLHTGDSVTVSGMGRTSPTGFQTIFAQSIKDATSGQSVQIPAPGAPAPFSGSGKIQQLNYGPGGEVNGFLMDNGVLAVVPPFGASNPSSIKSGATVSYSGYAHRTMNEKTVVALQSLTIDGQQITLTPLGRWQGRRGPFGPRGGPDGTQGVPAPPVPPGGAVGPGAPAGRLEEPPPPPPPPSPGEAEQAESE